MPRLFKWKEKLAALDALQNSLPYIFSRLLVVLYLALAYLSVFRTSELLETRIGVDILVFVSAFWTLRAILQIRFFGLFGKANEFSVDLSEYSPWPIQLSNQTFANVFFVEFLIMIALYLIPAARAAL